MRLLIPNFYLKEREQENTKSTKGEAAGTEGSTNWCSRWVDLRHQHHQGASLPVRTNPPWQH